MEIHIPILLHLHFELVAGEIPGEVVRREIVQAVTQEPSEWAVGFYEVVNGAGVGKVAACAAGAKELSSCAAVALYEGGFGACLCGGDGGHQSGRACSNCAHLAFHTRI